MNKQKLLAGLVVLVVLGGGGAYAFTQNSKDDNKQSAEVVDAMEKKDAEVMEKKDGEAMEKSEGEAMSKQGTYVTLADFDKNPSMYADTKKVYFFHASWCPICKQIDKDIKANGAVIPSGVTLIKTDFDSSTSLRQKYGVNTQYTFVQVDNDGNELKQWPGPNIEDAMKEIL